ncbi:ACT domain-containing protein [Candidatus Micrarchaeota archaeon]|nr:ACT domain-containing protein [Candidatus Micrarchaeota archaeon]
MKQLVVVAVDKVGLLARVARVLAKAKVNIESVSCETAGKQAIIRIVVSSEVKASSVLKKAGFEVVSSDALVVKIANKLGALAEVAEALSRKKINIENVHLVHKGAREGIFAIKTSKQEQAMRLLKKWF